MRASPSLLIAALTLAAALSPSLAAQNETTTPKPPVVHIADGGTGGRMESIFLPPLAGAPFNLVLATEWSRPLGNGGSYTLVNQRRIVRDGKGRIYQERWLLVPKGGKIESKMDLFQISDPTQHTWFNCIVATKVCNIQPYTLTTSMIYKPTLGVSGPLPDNKGFRLHEELGLSTANGVNTTGYRDTVTLNPGVLGNDQPMVTMREFWYSPQLGINLISLVDSPESGRQHFSVVELSTSEPDPRFFDVPEGYKIVDQRKNE